MRCSARHETYDTSTDPSRGRIRRAVASALGISLILFEIVAALLLASNTDDASAVADEILGDRIVVCTGSGTVVLEEVVVTSQGTKGDYRAPSASTGIEIDTPLMQTPMSIQVVPNQIPKDQGVTSSGLTDTLASVGIQSSGFGTQGETFTFRGFTTSTSLWNGFRIEEATTNYVGGNGGIWMGNVDRLEILKGPSAVLYGRAEPGGAVNVLTKKPLDESHAELEAGVGSWSDRWAAIDVTGPARCRGSSAQDRPRHGPPRRRGCRSRRNDHQFAIADPSFGADRLGEESNGGRLAGEGCDFEDLAGGQRLLHARRADVGAFAVGRCQSLGQFPRLGVEDEGQRCHAVAGLADDFDARGETGAGEIADGFGPVGVAARFHEAIDLAHQIIVESDGEALHRLSPSCWEVRCRYRTNMQRGHPSPEP